MISTDVVIIGAGPTGLFSIFECGMLQLNCHVFDALDCLGGQCSALYPEKPIYDIPSHPCITGGDLAKALIKQAEPFKATYHLEEQITKLEFQPDKTWLVESSKGTVVSAKAILIAAGVGAFGPNKPPLENIERFEKLGCVQYWVTSKESYKGKTVVIAGGGDSAVDWAIELSSIAKKVYVVHRRPKFRCAPESQARLESLCEAGAVELVVPYQLKELVGEEKLEVVRVATLDGETKDIEADCLLPFFGLSMNLGPILDWGLHMDKQSIKVEPATMATNQPGIYAVGDVAEYPGKLKLILTGFSEAAQAAHAIRHYIYPDEVRHFAYSTTQGVPQS